MSWKSALYALLKASNDINAIAKGKVGRRIGRRSYGKATGRIARRLFGVFLLMLSLAACAETVTVCEGEDTLVCYELPVCDGPRQPGENCYGPPEEE